jgi:hypothetical protein
MDVWNDCVEAAKNKLGKDSSYQFINGRVLKEAQKAYCAIMVSKQ